MGMKYESDTSKIYMVSELGSVKMQARPGFDLAL